MARRYAALAALLALVATAVQARGPLRQLLQTVPPTYAPKTTLPLKPLDKPLYGPCSTVGAAVGRSYSSGSWSGRMQCEGIDTGAAGCASCRRPRANLSLTHAPPARAPQYTTSATSAAPAAAPWRA
jgi:hypothetical protein